MKITNEIDFADSRNPVCPECACILYAGKFCTRSGCYLKGIPQLQTGHEIWAPPKDWPGKVNVRFCRFRVSDGSRQEGHHQCRYLAKFWIAASIDQNKSTLSTGFCNLHQLAIARGSPS